MTEIELFFVVVVFLRYNSAAKSQVIENFVLVRRVNFEKKKLVDKIQGKNLIGLRSTFSYFHLLEI